MHIRIRRWVKVTFILIIIGCTLFLYSRYINTKGLKVKEYAVIDSLLPSNFYGLKIIQISDIHYKITTTKEDLEKMVKEINLLKPDIVILSGDLFDSNIKYEDNDYEDISKILKSIDYTISKYAINLSQQQ